MDETCKRVRRLTTKIVRTGKEILRLRSAINEMTGEDQSRARRDLTKMVEVQRRRISATISLLESMGVNQLPRGNGELLFPTSDDMRAIYRVDGPAQGSHQQVTVDEGPYTEAK